MGEIGIIGAGNIGGPIAARLAECGHRVTVCDRDAAARAAAGRLGIAAGERPAACAGAAIVLVLVADDRQVEAVLAGPSGLVGAIDPARPPLVAVMSTVLPDTVRAVAAELAQKGVRMLDAPVSGGAVRARQGQLTVMVGGDAADLAAARPVFDSIASTVHLCGAIGAGQTTKIVNNLVGVANLMLFSEAMSLAVRLGLDPASTAAVMEASSGRNAGTQDWRERQELLRTNSRSIKTVEGLMRIVRKDLALAVALARRAEMAAPVLDAVAAATDRIAAADILECWRGLSAA
jgi:3-hydroxyisobutyrate dehydrogenase-like beta-hydroxyacid dehydrogenase